MLLPINKRDIVKYIILGETRNKGELKHKSVAIGIKENVREGGILMDLKLMFKEVVVKER